MSFGFIARSRALGPPLVPAKRSAQDASRSSQGNAQSSGDAEVAPNKNSLEALSAPPHAALRSGGDNFRICDSGPCADQIPTFGRERNIRPLAQADAWGGRWRLRSFHLLRCQIYAKHAADQGYFPPFLYALLARRANEPHTRTCGEVRALRGRDCEEERLVDDDFKWAKINAPTATSAQSEVVGRFPRLAQSRNRKAIYHGGW